MRAPAASVPRWLGALGSVTELSPLELSLTAPLTTHHPAISAWVGLCGSFHNLHPLLYVLCAQGCPRGKAHCQSVPGYAVSLRHKMRHLPEVLWFLVIGIMPPPSKFNNMVLYLHSTSLISVLFPSFRLPGAFAAQCWPVSLGGESFSLWILISVLFTCSDVLTSLFVASCNERDQMF